MTRGELVSCCITSVGWRLLAVRGDVTVLAAGVAVSSGVALVESGVDDWFPGTGGRALVIMDHSRIRIISRKN
jgi:hypothetical protein